MDAAADSAETRELLQNASQGDGGACEQLLDRHRPELRDFVELRLDGCLRARLDASDVVQEAHLEALRRFPDYLKRRPMPFLHWLRRTAYERLLMLRRRHVGAARRTVGREEVLPDGSSLALAQQLLAQGSTPSQRLAKDELARRVQDALAQISETDRDLLLMRSPEAPFGLSLNDLDPRGIATNAAGTIVWVVDGNMNVYVYTPSGTLLGSWSAGGLSSKAEITGITTDGTNIWLVDYIADKIYKYTGAASRRSGSQTAASSFALASGRNGDPNPENLVTDGTSIWVVDDTAYKVFKYTVSGSLLGSWSIDARNKEATGIAIDPTNVSNIWIVDSGTLLVYQYTAAASRTSGSQNAAATFALAAGDTNPLGIADPPPAGDAIVESTPTITPAPTHDASIAPQTPLAPIWSTPFRQAEPQIGGNQFALAVNLSLDALPMTGEAHEIASLSATTALSTRSIDQAFAGDLDAWLDLPASLDTLRKNL